MAFLLCVGFSGYVTCGSICIACLTP
ncbi:DUF3265 domain-containing protein [Vibrio alginolyticus]|nr:DUF3265 domain-containing protein [Vibrio parahaemolyticus]MCR9983602.1 DUF3265 domain-containing protein [Vibrio alginolyticus]